MSAKTHGPEQNLLDYRKQRAIRNAPFLGLFATLFAAVAAAYLGASLSVHFEIGRYAPNFFPGYVPKPLFGLPVYSPVEFGKMAWQFWAYPLMQQAVMFAGIVTAVPTLGVGIWQFIRSNRLWNQQFETDLHGSAHWATRKEACAMSLLPAKGQKPSNRVCYVGGFVNEKDQTEYLQHAGAEHIIAFAPTRSGKGVGLVLPTLLGGWQESVVVHDIKGENYLLTAGYRQTIGQGILKFNPGFGMAGDEDQGKEDQCCHFNPLEEIRVGSTFEVKDVMNIATMIVDPDGKGLNDHWQKTGFALLTSVILHVLYAEKDKTLRGVAAYLNNPALQEVDDAFKVMISTEHDPSGRFHWKDGAGRDTKVHPVIAQSAKEMLNKAANEKSGVISTMMSFLSLYRDPIVAKWTEYSDFRIKDLQDADQPVSLYLVTSPEDKNRLKPLIRLVLNQIVSKFTSEDRLTEKGGRMACIGKHPLLMLLDEFPSLGKMDIFLDSIAFLAGYNVKLYLITQDKSQLEDENRGYGKSGGGVIINNCHVRVIYAPNEISTAEWVSKQLGKKTVSMENVTQSMEGGFIPSPKGQSRSIQFQGRDLLTPDEVLRLRGPEKRGSDIVKAGDMLVLVAGFAPVYGRQILYFRNPTFLERAQIPPPAHGVEIVERIDYEKILGHSGVIAPTVQPGAPEGDPFEGMDGPDDQVTPVTAPVSVEGLQATDTPATETADTQGVADSEETGGTDSVDIQDAMFALDETVQLIQETVPEFRDILLPDGSDEWRPDSTRVERKQDKADLHRLMGSNNMQGEDTG
ncbi:type IV secretory system conjugative DNA transfer family protein [Acidithiobacillus thiooxidans]|uniref:Conjugal transfer protein TraG n=2 Tax=Acidithiobacillus thiooxidans TaxID=930 RepID=A0A1C2IFM6_ACITH|nr:type IV secretory system conjugative DNA transfer family protein [Acidithiobacillus thiooxidans]MBU2836948.1 type IV secretory system conjugative DNA transfer family protein [Acidithiobacillus thiooxidans]OCX74791.1 conjugal transfer protein TraG [Acidithiobacillus thiooxidans]OCX79385.1 conjugal transfer protein TraG [Acidithiobacillus thiooxidans]QFX96739.1 conjugal transfer protein TraG [Acidithiobacillus thiooxidans ATCC 19377]